MLGDLVFQQKYPKDKKRKKNPFVFSRTDRQHNMVERWTNVNTKGH